MNIGEIILALLAGGPTIYSDIEGILTEIKSRDTGTVELQKIAAGLSSLLAEVSKVL